MVKLSVVTSEGFNMFVMIEDLYQHILIVSYVGLYEEDHCQKSYFTKKKKIIGSSFILL